MSYMVELSCIVSLELEEPHMTRSLSNTVRMSLDSMAEQLLCLTSARYSDNPSTKDCVHMKRSGGTIGVTVHFTSSMALQTKKE